MHNTSSIPKKRPQDRCYTKLSNLLTKTLDNPAQFVQNTSNKRTKTRSLLLINKMLLLVTSKEFLSKLSFQKQKCQFSEAVLNPF